MEGVILDIITETSGKCFLTKIKLGDYITSVPENYKDYDVQREIVSNVYLDNLIQTVFEKKHIPPIVLVLEEQDFKLNGTKSIEILRFKILDGLQRTFRLKTIYDTVQFLKAKMESENILQFNRLEISRKYRTELETINSSSAILTRAIELYERTQDKDSDLLNFFEKYQWFEVWTDLSPEEEVNKMLILNAGHKPVKTKHQLELLFMNILPIIQKVGPRGFEVKREKEISSTSFSKNRIVGQFHFSHLIISILSIAEKKPLTTNVDLIQKRQSDYFDDTIFETYLNFKFLHTFLEVLLRIDQTLAGEYPIEGTKWMGREISLVGMFAATGKYAYDSKIEPDAALRMLEDKVIQHPASMNLSVFEEQRNSVDLAKVNIGTINKRAVYNGVYDLLISGQVIQWSKHFKSMTYES